MGDSSLTDEQLDNFNHLLHQRREALSAQLSQIDAAAAPVTLDQQSVGRVSRIDAIQQQQMAIANKTQLTQSLQRIEPALQRIADGSYGYCLRCGESITLQRLEVQPEATLCLDCQSESENA